MANWGDPYPYNDQDEGVDLFSIGVILVAFVLLAIVGVVTS